MDTLKYKDERLQLLASSLLLINWDKFSLKGGSAINLFFRPLTRLSFDIDLNYRRVTDRTETLGDISKELQALSSRVNNSTFAKSKLDFFHNDREIASKLHIETDHAEIKIEPNFILRGSVFEGSQMKINHIAAELLNVDHNLTVQVMSFEDVFAGKMCAALDRQLPRDLYDIWLLLENEGISKKTKDAFLVYLCSNNRTISELLSPTLLADKNLFNNAFIESTSVPFSYEDYIKTHNELVKSVHAALTDADREFIKTFTLGDPQWDLVSNNLDVTRIQVLPGIQWKLINVKKMDTLKMLDEVKKLESIFNIHHRRENY